MRIILQRYYIRPIYLQQCIHTHVGTSGPACPIDDRCDRKKKRGRKTYQGSPYIGFMPLAVRCWWSLCVPKSVVGCVPMCRNCEWDICEYAHDVGAGGLCCQDLAMVGLLGQAMAGAREDSVCICVERVCKHTGLGEKMKRKMDSPVRTPTKQPTSTDLVCRACAWLQWGHGNGSIGMVMGVALVVVIWWWSGKHECGNK